MFPSLKTSLAPLILRFGLAAIFIYHGFLEINCRTRTGFSPEIPAWFQVLVSWANIIGGIALIFGLLTRVFALWFTFIMFGAIFAVTGAREFVHLTHYITKKDSPYRFEVGYEYNFAIIVICLTLFVLGSGRFSLDRMIFHRGKAAPLAASTEGKNHQAVSV
jgi:putative oxidoreductase